MTVYNTSSSDFVAGLTGGGAYTHDESQQIANYLHDQGAPDPFQVQTASGSGVFNVDKTAEVFVLSDPGSGPISVDATSKDIEAIVVNSDHGVTLNIIAHTLSTTDHEVGVFTGDGADHINFDGPDAGYISSGGGDDYVVGGGRGDTILAGSGDDTVIGGAGADSVLGGDGADSVYGGAGADTLDGGAGDDHLFGDAGNDSLYGGDGNDTIEGGAGADQIFGDAGNDSLLGGDGADTIYGGAGDDHIYGEAGNDSLWGGDGNDTILGGAGNDTLYGGDGNDSLVGGSGNDTFVETKDTHDPHSHDTIIGGDGHDTLVFQDRTDADWTHATKSYDSTTETWTIKFSDGQTVEVSGVETFKVGDHTVTP